MTPLVLGIDIGGTKIAVGLVTSEGTVLARVDAPTPAIRGGEHIVATAVALARELMSGNPVRAVGIGSAGVIDPRSRRVISATDHISHWAGTDLGRLVENALAVPVVVRNDVHAHAVGEAFVGAGRGYDTVLVAAIGTGIGGAVVVNGSVQAGTHGVAGHFGHVPVPEAAGMLCPCGKFGHVEAISSGSALHQLYLRRGGDPRATDTRAVVAMAAVDPIAYDAVVTSAEALGRALGGLVNAVDPAVVIVAGGMRNAGELWWSSMEGALRDTALPILQDVLVTKAALGDDAAIIGAAKHAFDYLEDPT